MRDEDEDVGIFLSELDAELKRAQTLPLDKRKIIVRQLTLKWHPDKQVGNEAVAKRVFQFLQEKKESFLS